MLYFAYGSNMSERRLRRRVPSAQKISTAALPSHQLVFHKKSLEDGSGKCDAYRTSDANKKVIGVVFELDPLEKLSLDHAEGIGIGYVEHTIKVFVEDNTMLKVNAYFAIAIDPSLKPYHWYKEHVLRGAIENGLPQHYIRSIQEVESVEDPYAERAVHELSIYR